MQLKMYIFVLFVCPCMHHNYGGISESHACKDCVWPIILDADLYASCPGYRVLVVMTHQVQCNQNRRRKVLNRGASSFFSGVTNLCAGEIECKNSFYL